MAYQWTLLISNNERFGGGGGMALYSEGEQNKFKLKYCKTVELFSQEQTEL